MVPDLDKDKLMELLMSIMRENEKEDFEHGRRSDYEWELGVEVLFRIGGDRSLLHSDTKKTQLFGVDVRPNYQNPGCIKLWREVSRA